MELLTVDHAATRLGVSRRTVYRWIADGLIEPVEGGRGVRIPIDQIDRITPPPRSRTPATGGDVATHVLEAARAVLVRAGHAGLTIEHVADEADMSVGGVLYHFPTKAALVDALVAAFLDGFEADWRAAREAGRSAADAYVTASIGVRDEQRAVRAVLLAALDRSESIARIDRRVKQWYHEIETTSANPDGDRIRCLAADAVWLFGLLGVRPVRRADERRLLG